MQLISNFDIYQDFYADPQITSLFQEEIESNISSQTMWALLLYLHPKSKYYPLDHRSKLTLIEKDYLKNQKLKLEDYPTTIAKIKELLLTKPERALVNWEQKLEERDALIASIPYNSETYDMLDKMMSNNDKLWKTYLATLKQVTQEEEGSSQGDIELSFLEKDN